MKNLYKVTFEFLHIKNIGYFEIADIDDLCKYEIKTKIIKAENPQSAQNIIKHNWGKSVSIKEIKRIEREREKV